MSVLVDPMWLRSLKPFNLLSCGEAGRFNELVSHNTTAGVCHVNK